MRSWIIALGLLLFWFIVPLQFFIIGNDYGYGVQGAVYRYQITTTGISLIPIPWEMTYITSGIYTGNSALSILLWFAGTLVLALTAIISLIHLETLTLRTYRLLYIGMAVSGVLYLGSCIARYGIFFSGPAGVSIPVGIIVLMMCALFLFYYQNIFLENVSHHDGVPG
ncbi:MAG: hypothetical protein WC391_08845 [Methanoregula sp.]